MPAAIISGWLFLASFALDGFVSRIDRDVGKESTSRERVPPEQIVTSRS